MRIYSLTSLTAACLMAGACLCSAAPITYNVAETIGNGGVSGFIQTDGTLGSLSTGNIIAWNLTLDDGVNSVNMTEANSAEAIFNADSSGPSAVTGTATQLLFDFGDLRPTGDSSSTNLLIFNSSSVPGYLCFVVTTCAAIWPTVPGYGQEQVSATPGFVNAQLRNLSGVQVIGTVDVASTPEPSTLALLAAGIVLAGFTKSRATLAPHARSGSKAS
jgi:hypothetical protein